MNIKGNRYHSGSKSITFHIEFGEKDRTLKEDEINLRLENVIKILENKCNAKIRE